VGSLGVGLINETKVEVKEAGTAIRVERVQRAKRRSRRPRIRGERLRLLNEGARKEEIVPQIASNVCPTALRH